MTTNTTKSAPAASAKDNQLTSKTSETQGHAIWLSSAKHVAETTKKGTLSGFRKMREALMAKKFESHDNVPVAVDAVSGLYIGSYGAANNYEALTGTGITHILCVSRFPHTFTYMQLKVADLSSVKISTFFDEAFSFIDSALSSGGKVLVHCVMGRSRSATIVVAYLIARQGLTLSLALRELRRNRPQAQPNSGFYQELVSFEAKLKKLREEVVEPL
ncbi:unnamed protein product [Peronospora belbahrii]|uniref:protein-tyrosine-phosphatase n=1 Tax=Peronospora belbahrii TaxID=622444 RepID=A0AAU9L2T3_9STRA|nr:unnamed protein product [Peronospora belbahrii]